MAGRLRAPISGPQLLLALVVIVTLTMVAPPGAAWGINRHRVAQTLERARLAAEDVRSHADARGLDHIETAVVCGPGKLPKTGALGTDEWVRHTAIAPEVFGPGMPTDAWSQCYLMNVGQWKTGGHVWILSAGPNGRVDTPMNSAVLVGDDIGVMVR